MTNEGSAWKTHESLLRRVRNQGDEQSWEDFVHYYRPFIYNVVRGMNIAHHDAEELVQTVLLKSWNKLPDFEYDRGKGRFRGWLCQVTGNSVRDFLRKRRTSVERISPDNIRDNTNLHCIDLPEVEKIAEKEWKRYISKLAWETVSKKFKPHVAQAFLMAAQRVPTVKIGDELGIAESSVYVYKCRVQKELRSEIIRLNRFLG
jgi:RNA polymerase sigma factor (sigma-70 family)